MTLRVSEAEWEMMQGRQKRNKYGNKKTAAGDASKREGRRREELEMLGKAGEIRNLRRQVPFALVVNRMLICQYIADFVYEVGGREIVEDAKGFRTDVYRLKKKLMLAIHGIEIVEV